MEPPLGAVGLQWVYSLQWWVYLSRASILLRFGAVLEVLPFPALSAGRGVFYLWQRGGGRGGTAGVHGVRGGAHRGVPQRADVLAGRGGDGRRRSRFPWLGCSCLGICTCAESSLGQDDLHLNKYLQEHAPQAAAPAVTNNSGLETSPEQTPLFN